MATKSPNDLIRVLVGPDQREFVVHKELLCASSPFFRDSIDAVPDALAATSSISASSSPASDSSFLDASPSRPPLVIWLAGESAGVFELFVLWLYRRHAFRAVIEEAVTILSANRGEDEEIVLCPLSELSSPSHSSCSSPSSFPNVSPSQKAGEPSAAQSCSDMHWNLVNLHLFAALIDIPALQDVVMDTLQDLYLRFDWVATPSFVHFLYVESDPFAAFRLRKWAVALFTWTLANRGPIAGSHASQASRITYDGDTEELRRLLDEIPQLRADYDAHLSKMIASRADARIKNPQLRIPSNSLRREDRHFGFRQCSFHSHRRAVAEGRCPHSTVVRTMVFNPTTADSKSGPAAIQGFSSHQTCRHAPSSSLSSTCSSVMSEPRLADLPVWSPLSATTPGIAPLGMESTI